MLMMMITVAMAMAMMMPMHIRNHANKMLILFVINEP